jgi:hypothetical protein
MTSARNIHDARRVALVRDRAVTHEAYAATRVTLTALASAAATRARGADISEPHRSEAVLRAARASAVAGAREHPREGHAFRAANQSLAGPVRFCGRFLRDRRADARHCSSSGQHASPRERDRSRSRPVSTRTNVAFDLLRRTLTATPLRRPRIRSDRRFEAQGTNPT